MVGFKTITPYWSVATFVFYILIILCCCLLAAIPNYTVRVRGIKHRTVFSLNVFLCGAILLFVKGLGTTGTDLRGGYYSNFLSAHSIYEINDTSLELGYRLLNVICLNLTGSYAFFILMVSIITICPVLFFLNKYREQIDLKSAVLLYVSVFFYPGFSGFRLAMAASLSLFVFNSLIKKEYFKSLVFLIVAAMFHRTALCLVLPISLIVCKKIMNIRRMILICSSIVIALFGLRFVFERYAIQSERYWKYVAEDRVHIGFEQIVYYLPVFLLLYLCKKKVDMDKHYVVVCYVWSFFTYGMCMYAISALGRLFMYSIPLVLIVPYYIKKDVKNRAIIELLVVFYCLCRFMIYIVQYYALEAIMPYTNAIGWTI